VSLGERSGKWVKGEEGERGGTYFRSVLLNPLFLLLMVRCAHGERNGDGKSGKIRKEKGGGQLTLFFDVEGGRKYEDKVGKGEGSPSRSSF